jgi:TPR repeat protein
MKTHVARIALAAAAILLSSSNALCQTNLPVLPIATDEPRHALLRRWLPAAEAGDAEGQYTIGLMQLLGKGGVSKNVESGLSWLRMAAKQGFAEAEIELGVAHQYGPDVKPNPVEARNWFESAARRGNARAQLLLGSVLDEAKNYTDAAYWYRQAALQGRSDAQHLLGLMHRDGLGVQKDATEAVKWFRVAAEKGSPDGQYDLGASYANGFGLERDPVAALAWFKLAAERGHKDARIQVEKFGRTLSEAEVRKADSLAKEFVAGARGAAPKSQ